MNTVDIMGTQLLVTSYADLGTKCCEWARMPRSSTVEFTNTQNVVMRRHDPAYKELTDRISFFVPDGMPVIWCMNRGGAGLKDRVYGPTFMREFLSRAPAGTTHYLLGGSEECGKRLREKFLRINPGLKFVGSFHGRCGFDGKFDAAGEQTVKEDLDRLSPDFIWVGLGAPKQQMWLKWHQASVRRGVILLAGFAFDVNAGLKRDAPLWMQRIGLTWMFRFFAEPKRLGPRYIKYNSLFLWYLFWDGIRGRAIKPGSEPVNSTGGRPA